MATKTPIEITQERLETALISDKVALKYFISRCTIDDVHRNIVEGEFKLGMIKFIDFLMQTEYQEDIELLIQKMVSEIVKESFLD